ncbi:MAG: hypothetical protein HPY61_00440 [Methanotrichaceae archaeon]|nr:hypothetical protein [Methanotrichaceae archaeon]
MQRLNCERYPCHFPEQDCSLCFCPFYPCMDDRFGGYLEDGVWCCRNCTIVHLPEVSNMILDALMDGQSSEDLWKRLVAVL